MKNQKQKNPVNSFQKEITTTLLRCRKLIKSPETRQEAIQILDGLDSSKMSPENKVLYLYVNGRYHYYMHKQYGDIEALEWSNDYLDDLASYAYEHKIPLELPMIYTRAYVKYQLANLVWDEDRKPWLLQKAKHITDHSLKFHPTNSSFLWLKSQLED